MNLSQEDIELIDRYFRKELSDEELISFNSRRKGREFAEEVGSNLKILDIIKLAGRETLARQLFSIQEKIEKGDGYQNYKPSYVKKGYFGNWLIGTIVIGLVGITAYFYFTGKLNTESFNHMIYDSSAPDTVYHYKINKDTIIVNSRQKVKSDTIRTIKYDTTYIKTYLKVNEGENQIKEGKLDTIYIRK